MKALKIIAVVLGALLLLTGIGLVVGSSLAGAGQQAFDSELNRPGFGGPVKGRVTGEDSGPTGEYFIVEFTDKDGDNRTGTGSLAPNTRTPSVGDEVDVLYLLDDPDRIVIIDLGPAADFSGIGNALRIAGIVCLVLGALLLAAGIIGLVVGRKRPVPGVGPPGGHPPVPPQSGPQPRPQPAPQPAPQFGPQQGSHPAPQQGSSQAPQGNDPSGPPPGAAPWPPQTGPPGPRPDYLSGPPNSGGPPGQPPR